MRSLPEIRSRISRIMPKFAYSWFRGPSEMTVFMLLPVFHLVAQRSPWVIEFGLLIQDRDLCWRLPASAFSLSISGGTVTQLSLYLCVLFIDIFPPFVVWIICRLNQLISMLFSYFGSFVARVGRGSIFTFIAI